MSGFGEEGMMYNHHVVWPITEQREAELMERARRRWLVCGTQVGQTSRRDRLFVFVGELLVDLGTRLRSRYEPIAQLSSTPKSS